MMRVNRLALVVLLAAFVALLNWSYRTMVVPTYAYIGFTYHSVPLLLRTFTVLLAIAPATWMPLALESPSQVVYWFLYLMVLVPSLLMPEVALPLGWPSVVYLSGTLFVAFALLGFSLRVSRVRLPRVELSSMQFWVGFGIAVLALTGVVVKVFGFSLSLPSLSDVYGVRAQYKAALLATGGLVGYAVFWLGLVFNPMLLAYGAIRRRPLPFLVGLVGQLLLFSITGLKGLFFNAALVLTIVLVVERGRARFGQLAVGGALGITGLCAGVDLLTGGRLLTNILVRRVLMVPGLLSGFYYDFFRHHPKALLGHSVLAGLSSYPYAMAPPRIIGSAYFLQGTDANASVWSDAYANFGVGGVLAFTVLLGVVLWLLDSAARDHDLRLGAVFAAILGLTLSNTGLLTTMLTHGGGLVLVLLMLAPRYRGESGRAPVIGERPT